ncbi:MAG: amino acid ABC transporter permease, partial [Mycobacterium sp.]|nr:amino acid ABC transporter permease [Mycobacterium sp.]
MASFLRRLPAALIVLLLVLGLAPTAPAGADQCAPPGEQSASALPTNLAAAAKGPDEDKYTTATTEPLSAVNREALRLITPGTLTVGTLSDAPPSICINS